MHNGYDSDGKWIDTMQVCINGHVINDSYEKNPQFNQDYCEKCGKRTIIKCQNCHKPIPGHIHYEDFVSTFYKKTAPDHCRYCNKPYPWNRGLRKSKRGVKVVFGHLKKFIEWFAGVVQKLRKK